MLITAKFSSNDVTEHNSRPYTHLSMINSSKQVGLVIVVVVDQQQLVVEGERGGRGV